MNVTGLDASRDGYVKSLDSKAMGNVNRYAARGTILWTPDPDLKISLTGDFSHIDERELPGVLLGLVPNIPFTPVPSSIQSVSNLPSSCVAASVLVHTVNPACIYQQSILVPSLSVGGYSPNDPLFSSLSSFFHTSSL